VADERNLETLPENDEGGEDVEGHMETLPRADEDDDVEGHMETLPRADEDDDVEGHMETLP
jgi:hypothetical protein